MQTRDDIRKFWANNLSDTFFKLKIKTVLTLSYQTQRTGKGIIGRYQEDGSCEGPAFSVGGVG